jgi:exopolysaccharide biosynthesis polyprenyl glycosylphosphotransferase
LFRHGAEAGLVPAGRYADEAPADPAGTGEEGEVVGGLAGLVHAVAVNRVDGVVVALDDHDLPAVATVTTALRDLVVDVWLLPDPEGPTRWLAAEELAPGLSVLPVWRKPLRDWRAVAKRTEDLVLGSILFVAFLPVMLVCAALLVTAGPGPVVLRQRRYGYGSTPFMMYKFRTMRYNPADQSEALATVKGDKRVTRVGRFLRSSSLDELPQLLNVLRGEMSLVGPRPHIIEMTVQGRLYEHMVPEYLSRHRVKPGITGLAQIGGYRGLVDSQEKAQRRVDLDLRYVETWSVGLDLRILWRTIFKGFVSPGAY